MLLLRWCAGGWLDHFMWTVTTVAPRWRARPRLDPERVRTHLSRTVLRCDNCWRVNLTHYGSRSLMRLRQHRTGRKRMMLEKCSICSIVVSVAIATHDIPRRRLILEVSPRSRRLVGDRVWSNHGRWWLLNTGTSSEPFVICRCSGDIPSSEWMRRMQLLFVIRHIIF